MEMVMSPGSSPEKKNNPHFFKIILPGVTTERLGIPPAFFKHIGGESSRNVSIMGPSRNVWHVDLIKNSNGMFFQNGWPEFVKDHSLEVGEFLVFRYDGNLHFTVQIFDKSACEKEDTFYVKTCQDASCFGKYKVRKNMRTKETKVLNDYSYKVCKRKAVKHNQILLPGFMHKRTSSRRCATSVGESKKMTRIKKTANVYIDSSSESFKGTWKRKIENGNQLIVRGSLHQESGSKSLSDNQLVERDSLPRKSIRCSKDAKESLRKSSRGSQLSVLGSVKKKFVRSYKDANGFGNEEMKNVKNKPAKGASSKVCRSTLKSGKHNQLVVYRSLPKQSISSSRKSLKRPYSLVLSKYINRNPDKPGSREVKIPPCRGYISQRRRVTKKEIGMAFEAATSFKSKNPYFAVIMATTYVYFGFSLYLPTSFVNDHLPTDSKWMFLRDPSGQRWKVRYIYRTSGGSCFSGGWCKFSIANNLEKDDVCVFEVVKKWEMQVHIFRVVDVVRPLKKSVQEPQK